MPDQRIIAAFILTWNTHTMENPKTGAIMIRAGLLLCILVGMLAGCGDNEIRIGFLGPLTGKYKDLGTQGNNGAILAVETLNNLGGIDGRHLRLITYDDQGDRKAVRSRLEQIADDDLAAVVGPMISSVAMATIPLIDRLGIPFVSPTVSTPHLTGKKDLFFRVQPENDNWAHGLVQHLKAKTSIRTLLLAEDIDNSDYTFTTNDALARSFTGAGGTITARVQFSGSRTDNFKRILEAIRTTGPDGVVMAASASDVAALAKRLDKEFPELQIITPAWGSTQELINTGGEAVEGVLTVVSYAEDSTYPDFIDFKKRYEERFEMKPNFAAARAYDALLLIASALRKAGGDTEHMVMHLAPTLNVPGVIGPFTIDEYGDVERQVYVQRVENGTFTTVELR